MVLTPLLIYSAQYSARGGIDVPHPSHDQSFRALANFHRWSVSYLLMGLAKANIPFNVCGCLYTFRRRGLDERIRHQRG